MWPIVLADLFLPTWGPYLAAAAAGGAYVFLWLRLEDAMVDMRPIDVAASSATTAPSSR